MQEMQDTQVSQDDPLEEGMATHSTDLAWRIPWTEEPDGLQSLGLQSQIQMSDWAHAQFLHIEFKEEDSFKADVVVFLLPFSPQAPFWTPACCCDGSCRPAAGQDEFLASLDKASLRLISPLRPRG